MVAQRVKDSAKSHRWPVAQMGLRTRTALFQICMQPPFSTHVPVLSPPPKALPHPGGPSPSYSAHQTLTHPLRPSANAAFPVDLPVGPSVAKDYCFCCIFVGFSLGSIFCAFVIVLCLLCTSMSPLLICNVFEVRNYILLIFLFSKSHSLFFIDVH